jgi:hypothetical protein
MSEPAREREIRSVELQNAYMDEVFLYTHFERIYCDEELRRVFCADSLATQKYQRKRDRLQAYIDEQKENGRTATKEKNLLKCGERIVEMVSSATARRPDRPREYETEYSELYKKLQGFWVRANPEDRGSFLL